jgi:hypothetical protein
VDAVRADVDADRCEIEGPAAFALAAVFGCAAAEDRGAAGWWDRDEPERWECP